MRKSLQTLAAAPAALALAASALAGAATLPSAAQAQVGRNIVNCDAPGGRQQAGAAIGAVAGALVGSQLADNERALGAVVGGGVGAAAGSYIGCKQQRDRAAAYAGYQGRNAYVAQTNLRVRSGPSTRSAQVGSLQAGETFQVLGRSGGWVEVGYNGQPVGYVSSAYVRPVG